MDKAAGVFKGVILAAASGIVFGTLLLQGQLIKPITLYYQYQYSVDDALTNVKEQQVIELGFMQFGVFFAVGALCMMLHILFKSIAETKFVGSSDKSKKVIAWTDGFSMVISTIGMILWTTGYLVIGWEAPSYGRFYLVSLTLIPMGAGMLVWGSIPGLIAVVKDSVYSTANKSFLKLEGKLLFGLFAASPSAFLLVYFPVLRTTAEMGSGGVGGYYLAYRSLATLAIFPMLFMTVITFYLMLHGILSVADVGEVVVAAGAKVLSTVAKVGDAPKEVSSVLKRFAKKVDKDKDDETRSWVAFAAYVLFVVGMGLFGFAYVGTWMLYEGFIIHLDQTDLAPLNSTNANAGVTNESHVIFVTVMLMAAGSFLGRVFTVLLVKIPSDWHQASETIPQSAFAWLMHAGSVSTMVAWHYRASGDTTASVDDIYALGFFMGMFNSAVFLDAILATCLYFSTSHGAAVTVKDAEWRLLGLLTFWAVGMFLIRFNTGFLGSILITWQNNTGYVVDYPRVTLILACINGAALLMHASGRIALAFNLVKLSEVAPGQ